MATKTNAKLKTKPVTVPEKRGRGRPVGSFGKPREKTPPPQLGYRVNDFAVAVCLSRAAVLRAISKGEIKSVQIGRSIIVPAAELKRLGIFGEA